MHSTVRPHSATLPVLVACTGPALHSSPQLLPREAAVVDVDDDDDQNLGGSNHHQCQNQQQQILLDLFLVGLGFHVAADFYHFLPVDQEMHRRRMRRTGPVTLAGQLRSLLSALDRAAVWAQTVRHFAGHTVVQSTLR